MELEVEDGIGTVALPHGVELEAWDCTGLNGTLAKLNRRYHAAAIENGRRTYVSWDGHTLRPEKAFGDGVVHWRWGIWSAEDDTHALRLSDSSWQAEGAADGALEKKDESQQSSCNNGNIEESTAAWIPASGAVLKRPKTTTSGSTFQSWEVSAPHLLGQQRTLLCCRAELDRSAGGTNGESFRTQPGRFLEEDGGSAMVPPPLLRITNSKWRRRWMEKEDAASVLNDMPARDANGHWGAAERQRSDWNERGWSKAIEGGLMARQVNMHLYEPGKQLSVHSVQRFHRGVWGKER
eukprot:SAG31_NODE_6200_length_2127_cov_1.216469_2_plen_294_part_00